MIRIAILDDDESERVLMEKLTRNYFFEKHVPCEIRVFSLGGSLVAELAEKKYFDIFLLDMELGDRTGLQVAREIREYYQEPMIVYLAADMEHVLEAFEVNAFRFILKKDMKVKLPKAFDVLLPQVEQLDKRSYIMEKDNKIAKILYQDIFYIRKEGKYVTIYHRNGVSRQRKTLQNMYDEIVAEEFFYVDKSYIVNVQHILSCKRGELRMRNGEILPVSRPRYHAVREKILTYWNKIVTVP